RIGTEGTYAPFTFHQPSDNQLVGFDVEIGRAIAAKLGVKPEFVEGKWDGLIAGLNVNRYDVVINQVGISPERQAKYDFSKPYIEITLALLALVTLAIKTVAEFKAAQQLAAVDLPPENPHAQAQPDTAAPQNGAARWVAAA
ncbi:transporter substrate-binding domain-containing protein, partial [Cellulomonas oligotrophica]|uniref:transporter substrate-binding domain-containing protein n=1 Tax=Cellulomonas oligotrophica TaxID=931536 RepID=UPI0031E685F7